MSRLKEIRLNNKKINTWRYVLRCMQYDLSKNSVADLMHTSWKNRNTIERFDKLRKKTVRLMNKQIRLIREYYDQINDEYRIKLDQ